MGHSLRTKTIRFKSIFPSLILIQRRQQLLGRQHDQAGSQYLKFRGQRFLGEEPLVRASPSQAEGFLAPDCLQEQQNLPLLGILQTVHNSKNMVKWKGIAA